MAGPEGGVWGNEVLVPEGEKLTPQTAQYVKPAGQPDGDTTNGASGDENNEQDDPPKTPVVLMPDGTQVDINNFDPFAQQRAELDREKARVDGMIEVARGNGTGEGTGDTDTDTPPEDPLADNPLLQKIELDPNDNLITEEDRRAAERHNNLVDAYIQQGQSFAEREQSMQKEVAALRDTVGNRFLREDIAQATATTGVTEQELFAKAKETGIADVATLATLIVGEKAIQTSAEEAEAAAEAKRAADNAKIGSSTQSGGGGNNEQPEGRGVEDWKNSQQVAEKYKFGATG